MRLTRPMLVSVTMMIAACASDQSGLAPTVATLEGMTINMKPRANFEISRSKVIESYRALTQLTADGNGTGDELRRLADLELEASQDNQFSEDSVIQLQGVNESQRAIAGYERYLSLYPGRDNNDLILYQLSRAYAMEGESEKSLVILDQLAEQYPASSYLDEAQFRRGENLFVLRRYDEATAAYRVVIEQFPESIYFDKALYKFGWSQFKQNDYEDAINSFMRLLEISAGQQKIDEIAFSPSLSRAEQELLDDVLRVTSLAFSYLTEDRTIADYFQQQGHRSFEPLVYLSLAELYISKLRIIDGTDLFLFFGDQYPVSRYTPVFHQKAIQVYEKSGYGDTVLKQKIAFVDRYDVNTQFWNQQDSSSRSELQPLLATHLDDLATHFHAQAQATSKAVDFQLAAVWYRRFLSSFADHPKAPKMNFLLAESLFDAARYSEAVSAYENTAYAYPGHEYAAEAGYAALLTYDEMLKTGRGENLAALSNQRINSALKFAQKFPDDGRVSAVLLQTAEQYYAAGNYQQTSQIGYQLTRQKGLDQLTLASAWQLTADSHFAADEFEPAEKAYTELLLLVPGPAQRRTDIQEQIASVIYRQGEQARALGDHVNAAVHFSRLGQVVPESPKRIIAEYDATTAYIELKDWPTAIARLEQFRRSYPNVKKWQTGVSEKLALAYSENGNSALAAREMMGLSASSNSASRSKDLMWRAAELYQVAGDEDEAIAIYKKYVRAYPVPVTRSIELRQKIADSYIASNEQAKRDFWLREIVKADAVAGAERNTRTKYLAATASLELSLPLFQSYEKVTLSVPLKKSLARKKKLMQQSLDAYSKAVKYQVQEVTTEATYLIAQIYLNFAKALLDSQRPSNLDEDQLEEYNLLLEDQAFPFEEKAIDIHLSNFKRIALGTYNSSTQKSLKVLGELMPFRYAKMEVSEAYVDIQ